MTIRNIISTIIRGTALGLCLSMLIEYGTVAWTATRDTNNNEVIQTLTKDFETEFNVTINYPISVVDEFTIDSENPRTVAMCVKFGTFRYVEIKKKYWDRGQDFLEFVFIHEAAHCSFDLPHDDTKINYMTTKVDELFIKYYYQKFKQRMIEDLKQKCLENKTCQKKETE